MQQNARVVQILARNANRLASNFVVVFGAPAESELARLFLGREGRFLNFDYSTHQLLCKHVDALGLQMRNRFDDACGKEPNTDLVVVFLQKGNLLNEHLLASLRQCVPIGCRVILLGEANAGIRSAEKWLTKHVGPTLSRDSARHCVLFEAVLVEQPTVALEEPAESSYEIPAGANSLHVCSRPGVFSYGRLDEGTALLLQSLPEAISGRVLDFGCGTGVIGAVIKSKYPDVAVILADSSVFALRATKQTFERNGLAVDSIVATDVFSDISGEFDLVISNPPFHRGHGTDYRAVESFIAGCSKHLRPDGCLLLVANRFLPYESLLAAHFQITQLSQTDKFKILLARRESTAEVVIPTCD